MFAWIVISAALAGLLSQTTYASALAPVGPREILGMIEEMGHLPDLGDAKAVSGILGVRFREEVGPLTINSLPPQPRPAQRLIRMVPLHRLPIGEVGMTVLRDATGRELSGVPYPVGIEIVPTPAVCVTVAEVDRTLTGRHMSGLPFEDKNVQNFIYGQNGKVIQISAEFLSPGSVCVSRFVIQQS